VQHSTGPRVKGGRGRGGIAEYNKGRRARVDGTRAVQYRDEDRRKWNGWKEANGKDSKDSDCADHTVSSLAAARDSNGVTTMLAGCDI
jgi:hypothetical protein